jgi:undecaprenyl pyrophosphate phosphatase UppP
MRKGLFLSNIFLILAATICAIFALNLCYRLAIKNKLWWFGIYMLIPIIGLLACRTSLR